MNEESDWKRVHADEAEKALEHELVKDVIDEQMFNLGTNDDWVRYGFMKVAHYAASVARAQALGIDPDLLRLSPEEANSEVLRLAAEAVVDGIPTHLIEE